MAERPADVTGEILLLYELSLSVGRSLDLVASCRDFLSVLTARKNVGFASVWLRCDLLGEEDTADRARLIHAIPRARARTETVALSHPMFEVVRDRGYHFTSSTEPDYPALALTPDPEGGSFAHLALGSIGVLRLHRGSTRGFTERDLRQLVPVVDKLAVTLEGALAHRRLVHESEQRRRAERERERLERGLRHAQKMEALGQVSAGVAHDFNNLLASILGFNQLAQMRFGADANPKLGEYLEEIRIAGERGRELVSQLLTFSRGDAAGRESIRVSQLVDDSLGLIRSLVPSRVGIDVEVGRNDPPVYASAAQLQQVIMNLCINARDAMEGGGRLRLTVREADRGDAVCASCLGTIDGTFIELAVNDTGCGIQPDDRRRVFDPFFSTRGAEGTGMGLSVVHGIVHGHRGHIELESEVGIGTTLRVLLPRTGLAL